MWARMSVHCNVGDDVDNYPFGDGVADAGCLC